MNDYILELAGVTKDYIQGSICLEILKDINFRVARGKSISIVGASGSGKSTMLQIMGLLDRKFLGSLIFAGKNIKELSESAKENLRLNNIGFVYQYHHLLRDFSARENIAMPALIKGDNYENALKRADMLLEKVGMENRRFHFPGKLSGGEQQRVAVLRSIFMNPEIILADEPTGNLDSESADKVMKLLLDITKENNTSLIIVTHNQSIAKLTDESYELKAAKLYRI